MRLILVCCVRIACHMLFAHRTRAAGEPVAAGTAGRALKVDGWVGGELF